MSYQEKSKHKIPEDVEILAPVGGREQLFAAVRSGADAVYLGGKGFNARRNAENFGSAKDGSESPELTLKEAVSYAHGRGVKVYVTVNTLVFDDEMEALRKELRDVAEAGADAVILQDLAAVKILKEEYPTLPRHASTQMAVHNKNGTKCLEELGFHRAVLARELSIEEIRAIAKETKLDLESFVHGAHCMSLSGGCYLSSMIGGRSGNRGLCAQPCRLDFTCKGRDHALSLKDMCYLDHVEELADAGVSSFKIEGRMKRPEYVAGTVSAYRGGGVSKEALRAVFSRSGFTDGYLAGKRDVSMFGTRTKEDVEAAKTVLPALSELYRNERMATPVDMSFMASLSSPSVLTVTDGERWVTVEGCNAEKAERVPMTKAAIRKALEKTGGTPFFLRDLDCHFEMKGAEASGLALPGAELNRMRREALSELLNERSETAPHKHVLREEKNEIVPYAPQEEPTLRLRFETYEQCARVMRQQKGNYEYVLPIAVLLNHPELCASVIAELPALCFPRDEEALEADLLRLSRLGAKEALAEDLGGIRLARKAGFRVHGGANLNILNTAALGEYEKLGLDSATISFEAPMARIRKLGGTLPRGLIGYGYLPLMKMRACPAKTRDGCKGCTGVTPMTDRKGETFLTICRGKKYSELLNCVPLYIADKPIAPVDFITLSFTTEAPELCVKVLKAFEAKAEPAFRRTNGLYWRELL